MLITLHVISILETTNEVIRKTEQVSFASPLGLVGHTPNRSDWMAGDSKNLRVSLVAL
jgi:hypothetical protein